MCCIAATHCGKWGKHENIISGPEQNKNFVYISGVMRIRVAHGLGIGELAHLGQDAPGREIYVRPTRNHFAVRKFVLEPPGATARWRCLGAALPSSFWRLLPWPDLERFKATGELPEAGYLNSGLVSCSPILCR
jgi:hypothetical protein